MKKFAVISIIALLALGFIPLAKADPTFTKIPNPTTLPATQGQTVAWNPTNTLFAVGGSGSPVLRLYSFNGATFTLLSNPAIMPTGAVNGLDFSPDGTMLAVAHATSPFLTVYNISGTTFTKRTDPASTPVGGANGVAWAANNTHLAVGHGSSPFVSFYHVGGLITKMPNPTTLPTGTVRGLSYDVENPSGRFAVGYNTAPYLSAYTWDGTTYQKSFDMANTAYAYQVDYSDTYLASSVFGTNTVKIWGLTGAAITTITLTGGASNFAYGVAWNADGNYLAIAHDLTPFVSVYSRSGTTFTKLANPATLPTGSSVDADWSDDNQYLAIGHSNSPFFTAYSTGLPPPPDVPDAPVLGGSIEYTDATLSWTAVENALGYNLTRVSPNGQTTTFPLGLTPLTYEDLRLNDDGMWYYYMIAWNAEGNSEPSNTVYLNATFRPVFGDDGTIWGQDGRQELADASGMSYTSIGVLWGIVILTATAIAGYMFGQLAQREWFGTAIGSVIGVFLASLMGFFPVWIPAFMGIGGIAIFLMIRNRNGGN